MTKARNIAELANDISVDNNRDVTLSNLRSDQPMMFRNRIINGDMRIDQRNAGASVTPVSGDYTLDRFQAFSSASSKYSVQQSTTAPNGFTNSLLVTSSAATTVASGDYYMIEHKIEGFNTADLAWGTASAKTVTLSFKVYSSLTGTFGGSILNQASNRSYPFTYEIILPNTWTDISIKIDGDTSGTWLTTNSVGLYISFSLGMGSTYSGTSGSWTGSQYWSATGARSVVGTSGATFYITGVQLEEGAVPTPFEHRPIGTELSLCQRYYQKSYDIGTVPGTDVSASYFGIHTGNGVTDTATNQYVLFTIHVNPTMRAQPTFYYYSLEGTLNVYNTFTAGGMTRDETSTPLGGFWRGANIISGYTAPGGGQLYGFCYVLTAEL